jgi:hypothetical protein
MVNGGLGTQFLYTAEDLYPHNSSGISVLKEGGNPQIALACNESAGILEWQRV